MTYYKELGVFLFKVPLVFSKLAVVHFRTYYKYTLSNSTNLY